MTPEELSKMMGGILTSRANLWAPLISDAMREYGIDSRSQQAMFLAQIGHESGSLVYTREIASGEAYEGREDLGNVVRGDGRKFRGRGLIQITGRDNYRRASRALFGDERLLEDPTPLEKPPLAARSAAWWWKAAGLNALSDTNTEAAFRLVTRRINGGYNGLDDRLNRWARVKNVLSLP